MGLQQAGKLLVGFFLQGFILGTILFNVFVSDLDAGLKCILSKFADDTDSLEDRDALQRDLDKLEGWAINNSIKLNKCWILHLGWNNPSCMYRLRDERLQSSPPERALGVLAESKLNQSAAGPGSQQGQLCPEVPRAPCCQLGKGKDRPALLCVLWPHLEHRMQAWAPQYNKDIKPSESLSRSATKMVKGLEGKMCEERLRSMGLFSPGYSMIYCICVPVCGQNV